MSRCLRLVYFPPPPSLIHSGGSQLYKRPFVSQSWLPPSQLRPAGILSQSQSDCESQWLLFKRHRPTLGGWLLRVGALWRSATRNSLIWFLAGSEADMKLIKEHLRQGKNKKRLVALWFASSRPVSPHLVLSRLVSFLLASLLLVDSQCRFCSALFSPLPTATPTTLA